jgi:spermidine synthase
VSGLLWLCFTLSGAAALGLELLWMRSAGLVLGATAVTTATVLAAYFSGLGVGAALGRTAPARPVRRYGLLELGAAGGALWSVVVFHILALDRVQPMLAAGGTFARGAAIVLAVFPATLCLGATLPVLAHVVAPPGTVGRRGGLLYALNTVGGVLGIAAMGFGLPAVIGVRASYLAAAAVSGLTGALALFVGDRDRSSASTPVAARPLAPAPRLRAVAAVAGALALGLEVLWTRLFAQVLHNSVYSFAAVSLVFLAALALGAGLAALALGRATPAATATVALLGAAVGTVGGLWTFVHFTDGLRYVGMETGLGEYVLRIVALAAVTAGPGALASGAVLPSLWAAFGDRDGAARPVGDLTAVNTLGAVVGALAAGFVVLPAIGLRAGFLVAAVGYVVLADVIAPQRAGLRAVAYTALLGVVVLDPARAPLSHLAAGESLRASAEGPAGIVTVVDTGDDLQLRLDNFYVLGGSAAATNERRQGLLPLLLHEDPRHVAVVGLATGITASAAPALGVEETTVVELVPEVAAAARAHFGTWNAALLERPDVRLVVDDGRRYLAATTERYDVVVSDLFIPWHASAGNLYAREMFATVAHRLAPGGLFCQWLPLYQLTREEFEMIARTFAAVFPATSLWRNDFYPDRPVVGLVGRLAPRQLDLHRVGARLAALPDWSRDPLLATPQGVAMLYLGELSGAGDPIPDGPLDTDDRPLIEFQAPRLTRMSASGDKDWFSGASLAAFTDELAARSARESLPDTDDVTAARRGGAALYRYALAARGGDDVAAARFEADVRREVPEVVALGEHEAPVAGLADARRTLGTLRSEQERVRQQLDAMERRLHEIARTGGSDP